MSHSMLSIIMPVLNEAAGIEAALTALSPHRRHGAELIIVDGGSRDDTVARARPLADRAAVAPRGRAAQMNAGAEIARGDIFLFLHVDTRLPDNADALLRTGLHGLAARGAGLTCEFDRGGLLTLVAFAMNLRSRLTGIATGDQGLFVTRAAFEAVGGFPIALMEDVALSARLKRISRPLCLTSHVTTSARRWNKHGTLRTVLLMWRLRLAYFFGTDPARLAQRYGYVSTEQ